MANTLFESVRNAIEWFEDSIWQGPTPRSDTAYEVSLVGDDRTWRVAAKTVVMHGSAPI
jgi:hypothetical protein